MQKSVFLMMQLLCRYRKKQKIVISITNYTTLICSDLINILPDFKNATPNLNLNIFWIKTSIAMKFSALNDSINEVYPLKISLSSDKFNVLKTSSIEDRGRLFSETIGIIRIFCCFHPLQIDKMILFDNLIWHPHQRRVKSYDVSMLDYFFFP